MSTGGYIAFGDTTDGANFLLKSSRVRLTDNTDTAVRTVGRLRSDRDLHILAERGQETHQALAGKVGAPAVEQRRHLWLIDAHERRCRNLGETLALDHLTDVARELRLGQLLVRCRMFRATGPWS